MIVPANAVNQVLAVLLKGAGYTSMTHAAEAINDFGRQQYGLDLSYDHRRVARWLQGGGCDRPDLVAKALSSAWGTDVPPSLIWPDTRNGARQLPAHRQPFVAIRTLDELATFVRRDMLCDGSTLPSLAAVTDGSELVDAISRWCDADTVRLPPSTSKGSERVGVEAVEGIEHVTARLIAANAEFGARVSRDAAVGHLKSAVDLLNTASYDDATGNRLLAVVATLAAVVGRMCHDSGLEGPAQQYATYGLQAARESTHEHGPFSSVCILADLARQLRSLDQPHAALRLIDLAVSVLPDAHAHGKRVKAMLWNLKAQALTATGTTGLREVRGMISLAADLRAESRAETQSPPPPGTLPHPTDADLHRETADAYLHLASAFPAQAPDLAKRAEIEAVKALAISDPTLRRARVYSQISLAWARFLLGDTEQARVDAEEAVRQTAAVPDSARLRARLWEMLASDPTGQSGAGALWVAGDRTLVPTCRMPRR
ncbi:hypothetical protein ACN27G_28760 [Plantactinospora sp. WMMB334]|uniref:hypothetical protein n=1 Tax=Plantactinospora sp. WMMB334 TaxID=3404119 RepID=UPI003B94C5D1